MSQRFLTRRVRRRQRHLEGVLPLIIEFDCHIFNRWGKEIIHLTDPSQGWDGRYNGKLVPTGTYFYVIKARGSDNRDYNLSGHINIVNSRIENSSSGSEPVE